MSYVDTDNDDDINEAYDDNDDLEGEAFGRRRRRRRAPAARPIRNGPGVDSVAITTPRGSAQLQMAKPLASQEDLQHTTESLEDSINRANQRVASTQSDVDSLSGRVRKLQKDQAQQNMMTLLLAVLGQRDLQKQIDSKADKTGTTAAAADDSLTKLLPFLLLGGQGGDSNGMNPMVLALLVAGK